MDNFYKADPNFYVNVRDDDLIRVNKELEEIKSSYNREMLRYHELNNKCEKLEKENEELKKDIQTCEVEIDGYVDSVNKLTKEIEELKEKNAHNAMEYYKKYSEELRIEIEELKKENEELKRNEEINNYGGLLVKETTWYKILSDENERLQNLNSDLTGHVDYYKQLFEKEVDVKSKLSKELDYYEDHADKYEKKIEKLKEEIKQLVSISMTPECAAIKLKDLSIE